jgi:hypothetical protein
MTNALPVTAKPFLPVPKLANGESTYLKQPPRDTIVFDESDLQIQKLFDIFFEDLGGLELATIARADNIDGQPVTYSAIKNLSSLRRRFSPDNIISSFSSIDSQFSKFAINLLSRGIYYPYFDENGDLVIEIDDIADDESIEIQILSDGTIEKVFEK